MRYCFWLIWLPVLLSAQTKSFEVEKFTRKDGLSGNIVKAVVKDSTGFLWVATTEGLNRYDGNSFTSFFVPGQTTERANDIKDLLLLPGNRLVLATDGGLFIFNISNCRFQKLEVKRQRPDLLYFDNSFFCLLKGKNGHFWAGSWTGVHLVDVDAGRFEKSFFAAESLLFKERLNFAHQLALAPDSSVLVLARYNKKLQWLVPDFSKSEAIPLQKRFPGFVVPEPENNSWPPGWQPAANLPVLNKIVPDSPHSYWGFGEEGLYHLYSRDRVFMDFPELTTFLKNTLTGNIVSMLEVKNKLWLATENNGLVIYDKFTHEVKQWKPAAFFSIPYCDFSWSLRLNTDGMIWAGCGCGYFYINPVTLEAGRISMYDKPAAIDSENGIVQFEDSRGWIWLGLGNGNGLSCFKPLDKKCTYYLPATMGGRFPLRHPMTIAEDTSGNLWFGTQRGGGLAYWDCKKDSFSVILPGDLPGFDGDLIEGIIADQKGFLWLAVTRVGLLRFDIGKRKFTVFGRRHGLKNTFFNDILMDRKGYIWISTEYGLYRFDPAAAQFRMFLKKDGLPDDNISFLGMSGDSIFAGAKGQLCFFLPEGFFKPQTVPPVLLTQVLAEGREIKLSYGRHLRLKYTQNDIQLHFTAIELVSGHHLRFAYRLRGADNTWKEIEGERMVDFINLPSGDYFFEMKASLFDGAWSQPQVLLHLTLLPPWWATWWFRLTMILLLALTVWGVYRYRIRQLLEIQRVRNNISRDLHDDIGASLSNIEILSRIGAQRINDLGQVKNFLDRIATETKQANDTLHQIVWNINPVNDNINQLFAWLTRYAAEALETAGIILYIEAPSYPASLKVGIEKRRDLFLLFKEALNNIIRHAGASEVRIVIAFSGKELQLTISDNGAGFDTASAPPGNGLQNMQQRMVKWGGKCELVSRKNAGTTIRIQLPLQA